MADRLFMTPELMKEAYPEKRKRQKIKKLFEEKVIPQLLGTPVEEPMKQTSKGRNAKRHAYKRAKKAQAS